MDYEDEFMKYLDKDLSNDKVKFIKKIRCITCGFRICKINNNQTCLWCLNDNKLLKYNTNG